MAKARAIVKRRKAVRNIRKITKTMQMIATAKFQKSLKRAVGTKPYTLKIRELVHELAGAVADVQHPLLRRPTVEEQVKRVALLVITSNRGLAGAYNGSILRTAAAFLRQQAAAGVAVDLYVAGKKGVAYFTFQKRPITQRYELADAAKFPDIELIANHFIQQFTSGQLDAVHVASMNFISTASQKAEVMTLLPLAGVREVAESIGQQIAEQTHAVEQIHTEPTRVHAEVTYDFSPDPLQLLEELLPQTVKIALFQCFLDAATSENVARMVAMKSATDNADKMVKSLTMQYNRARQSQITTELSEIMGGVEAMKG